MFGLGTQELLVILVIVLVLFGANKLPQLARSLGSSLKEFKKGIDEGQAKEAGVSPPSRESVSAPAGERLCGQCKNGLAADWTHCPRCGTAVPQAPNMNIRVDPGA
jgi:sec-independent protein translocase protein TatA